MELDEQQLEIMFEEKIQAYEKRKEAEEKEKAFQDKEKDILAREEALKKKEEALKKKEDELPDILKKDIKVVSLTLEKASKEQKERINRILNTLKR